MDNIWDDIKPIQAASKEDIGYPTQKPLALLRRIIEASSNENDTVLDPFCGCATACVAADGLDRNWIGIDISPKAVDLVNMRLQDSMGSLFKHGYVITRRDIPKRTDLGNLPAPETHKPLLYGEQSGNCAGCRVHFPYPRNLTVDHIVSKHDGGTDHKDNLQLLCASCNSTKGGKTPRVPYQPVKDPWGVGGGVRTFGARPLGGPFRGCLYTPLESDSTGADGEQTRNYNHKIWGELMDLQTVVKCELLFGLGSISSDMRR